MKIRATFLKGGFKHQNYLPIHLLKEVLTSHVLFDLFHSQLFLSFLNLENVWCYSNLKLRVVLSCTLFLLRNDFQWFLFLNVVFITRMKNRVWLIFTFIIYTMKIEKYCIQFLCTYDQLIDACITFRFVNNFCFWYSGLNHLITIFIVLFCWLVCFLCYFFF